MGNEAPEGPLVAIVDDDELFREATGNLLQAAGFSTATFGNAETFLKSTRRRSAACMIADMRMPGMTGLDLYQQLVASGERIPTVLITAYPEDSVRARANEAGITCFLSKPFVPEELLECVREALGGSSGRSDTLACR
jgi:FixJ family two-component response regulator